MRAACTALEGAAARGGCLAPHICMIADFYRVERGRKSKGKIFRTELEVAAVRPPARGLLDIVCKSNAGDGGRKSSSTNQGRDRRKPRGLWRSPEVTGCKGPVGCDRRNTVS